MTTLSIRAQAAIDLWKMAMPTIPVPPTGTFLRWLIRYDDNVMEIGIIRTADKMQQKIADKLEIGETDAARYCTSIMRHKTEQRQT